jgi:diguanylate cyclase (GGDEF)-like protein
MKKILNARFLRQFLSGCAREAFTLKQVQYFIALSIGATHAVLLVIFAAYRVDFMVGFNVLSVLTYLCAYRFVKKDRPLAAFHLIYAEIVLHMAFALIMVGRDCGFEFYCFSMVVVDYYGCYAMQSDERIPEKFDPLPGVLLAIGLWLVLQVYTANHAPVYVFGDDSVHMAVRMMNFAFAMSAMFIFMSCYITDMLVLTDTLRLQNRQLEQVTLTDELTQIGNRRFAEEFIHAAVKKGDRFAVVIADIDDFKSVNDCFGHLNGDIVLVQLADCFKELLRKKDKLCRWGGEEFLIVLPDTTLGEATAAMERLRAKISNTPVFLDGKAVHVTMTFGIADAQEGETIQDLIKLADTYMYKGKNIGKNIVVNRSTGDQRKSALKNRRVQGETIDRTALPEMDDALQNPIFEAFANAAENVYIYVCDMKTGVSRWSPNAVDYFQMPGEYFLDAANIWMEKIHPDDRDRYFLDIESVFSGRQMRHQCQYRARNKYDDYVWLECKGSVYHEKTDVFAGMMMRIDNQSKYDALTGAKTAYELHNMDFESFRGIALLVGIQEFRKFVNSRGFLYGDYMLKEFAGRLLGMESEGFQTYRLQGVEFLILLPGETRKTAGEIFQRVIKMGQGLDAGAQRGVQLSVCGGAVDCPADGTERGELLSKLEHSLEYAKGCGKGTLSFFSKEIAERHLRESTLKAELTASIQDQFHGFELYYQPVVQNTERHRIVSCEALLRWRTESVPDSMPGEFIKILEQTGEIREVGLFVVQESVKMAKLLEKYGITVAFNVSSVQLRDAKLADYIIEEAKKAELESGKLIIELTESARVENPEQLADTFKRLNDSGFKIALDDFGTENSSISLISVLPADILKIDQSFVKKFAELRRKTDRAVIEAVISLAKSLDLQLVAEGIETGEMERLAGTLEVDYLQGYYYAKPMPQENFLELLENERSDANLT